MSLLLAANRGEFFSLPSNISINSTATPLTADVSFSINGAYSGTVGGRWYLPPSATIGNDIEIYAEEVGAPAGFTGTFDAWLPLSATQAWSLQQVAAGLKTGQINFSLRRVGDVAAFETQLCYFAVEVETLE